MMESIPDKHTPVLVIDDDEGLLLSIKATLVSSGLPEPALLSDSRNALELVRKYSFQLILLDLMMPHLNGMEVLKKIKDEFQTMLGPLGHYEFDELKNKNATSKEDLFEYINDLTTNYILTEDRALEFKDRIGQIFGEEKEKINQKHSG